MKIQYKGLNNFNGSEASMVKRIVKQHCTKIDIVIPKGLLVVHGKKHKKAGTRCKYSFVFRLEDPGFDLNAECSSWELPRALHAGMKKVQNGVNRKYRVGSKAQKKLTDQKHGLMKRIFRLGR